MTYQVTVKGKSKLEVVKRVIDLEKRGYECIMPIKQIQTESVIYGHKSVGLAKLDNIATNKFVGFEVFTRYVCVMRKEVN